MARGETAVRVVPMSDEPGFLIAVLPKHGGLARIFVTDEEAREIVAELLHYLRAGRAA